MTGYEPREGDIVNVRDLEVRIQPSSGGAYLPTFGMQIAAFDDLRKQGKVELVARAEPDWQPGDVGRHKGTGELFRYLPDSDRDDQPWLNCERGANPGEYRWLSASDLAGQLVRCAVVPEGELPPHIHVCTDEFEQEHEWTCHAGDCLTSLRVCENHPRFPGGEA